MEEDTQKCPPSCIKPPQCPLVHISFRFGRYHSTFPIFHISIFHITTSHRRHVPTRTMKWLVACTRTLASILVPATRHGKSACSHLFCFCAVSLPIHLLSTAFGILNTCACGHARFFSPQLATKTPCMSNWELRVRGSWWPLPLG